MSKVVVTCLLLILAVGLAQSQDTTVLDFKTYMEMVKNNHPIAQVANLQIDRGESTVRQARGSFDPKVMADVAQKYFKGDKYYSHIDGGLKIPTWFGLELRTGYEQNEGIFLNPEQNVPGTGLYYAGITLPIGQGLFIDERRAALRQAELMEQISQLEQTVILNELLYAAGSAYWMWYESYANLQIFQEALELAENRVDFVKRSAELGDLPAIDTLEAGIQLQNRQLSYQQAQLDFQNATAQLGVFLWADGVVPLEPAEGTIPSLEADISPLLVDNTLSVNIDTFLLAHPEIRQFNFKLDQLEVDRRWKQEQLKPELNLKYNALAEPIGGDPFTNFNIENYTWGVEFKTPLFLRKERASLQLTDIKIRETQFKLDTKQANLQFKARAALNTWDTTNEQIALYTRTVEDYLGLLEGERRMFTLGESSLFLVNARELGYINAQLKLVELNAKNRKAALQAIFSFGLLNQ